MCIAKEGIELATDMCIKSITLFPILLNLDGLKLILPIDGQAIEFTF